MLPTGNTFDNANNCKSITITSEKKMQRNNNEYKVGDKIIVKRKKSSKHELEFMGPFPITQINDNVTVRFHKGIINDATIICRIKSFFD